MAIYLIQTEYIVARAEALLDPWFAVRADVPQRVAYGPTEQAAKDRLAYLIGQEAAFKTFTRPSGETSCNGGPNCSCW